MGVYDVFGFGGLGEADAGYTDGGTGAFDAGAEGFDCLEGCEGIAGGEVVIDGGGGLGEEGYKGGAVGDGFIRGDVEGSPEGAGGFDAGALSHGFYGSS